MTTLYVSPRKMPVHYGLEKSQASTGIFTGSGYKFYSKYLPDPPKIFAKDQKIYQSPARIFCGETDIFSSLHAAL